MTDFPEQTLWQAVLTQAVRDILRPSAVFEQRKALAWVYYSARDFQTVCHMAGVIPRSFRRAVLEALFFKNLVQQGVLTMKPSLTNPSQTSLAYDCAVIHKAKALFQALYAEADLDKAIGNLSFQDCLDLCKQMTRKRARKPRSNTNEKGV